MQKELSGNAPAAVPLGGRRDESMSELTAALVLIGANAWPAKGNGKQRHTG